MPALDLIQLYSATQRVVKSLEISGLMPALKQYRAALRGTSAKDTDAAESRLLQAGEAYVEKTAQYSDDETSVVNLLHLGQLGLSSFWIDLTSSVSPVEVRKTQAVSAFSKIMFATSHLPGLLGLVRETSAVEGLRGQDPGAVRLVVRLYDSIESAASPERLARLLDAVDLLYSACASIADTDAESLQLMSVSGVAVRSVIFHGNSDAITATQRVISYLNVVSAESLREDNFEVESIATTHPFLRAIDNLKELGAISAETASQAQRNTVEGSIMLLETGAQLADFEARTEGGFMQPSVVARLDADARSFDSIDARIGDAIDVQYDQIYDREREKLIGDVDLVSAGPSDQGSVRGERLASNSPGVMASADTDETRAVERASETGEDGIDELMIDLNRLYREQR